MSLLDRYIKKAIGETLYLDVYRTKYDDTAVFGTIVLESKEFLCIKKIDEDGTYDGFSVVRRADVTQFVMGGKNRNKVQQLALEKSESVSVPEMDLTSLSSVIGSLSSQYGALSIYTESDDPDSYYIGKVNEVDDEYILLDTYGTEEDLEMSQMLFDLTLITRIDIDGKYENDLIGLYNKQNDWSLLEQ